MYVCQVDKSVIWDLLEVLFSRRGAVEKRKVIKGGRSYFNIQSAHKVNRRAEFNLKWPKFVSGTSFRYLSFADNESAVCDHSYIIIIIIIIIIIVWLQFHVGMDKRKAFSAFRMTSPPDQDSSLLKMAVVPSCEIDVNERFFPTLLGSDVISSVRNLRM
jgi:hypothetical protein